MKTHEFTVGPEADGRRLDVFLVEAGLGLSRRRIRQVIDVGGVYLNKKRVRVASRTVRRGDRVRMQYSDEGLRRLRHERPVLNDADILLDKYGVVAVNKPPLMPSQATKDQSIVHVVPALAALLKTRRDAKGPLVLVHRLDKETSGVLLVAVGNDRATWLTDQFRERRVRKVYQAICYGIPKTPRFTERAALSAIDQRTGDVRPVRAGGRPAVTDVRLVAANRELGVSLLECRPETGRSHQIRVHLAMNGLPIVGDKRYGEKRELPPALAELTSVHHFLHAESLEFQPSEKQPRIRVEAPPPYRFTDFLRLAGLV